MGLVVVARFSVLAEAQVARTVLESAGMPAFVMDEIIGGNIFYWSEMLQGYRLCVSDQDLAEARQLLTEARRSAAELEPTDLRIAPRTAPWVVAGLFPGVFIPLLGWAVEATRRKPTPARWVFLVVTYAMMAWLVFWLFGALLQPRAAYPE
jgi:hypothetical protein